MGGDSISSLTRDQMPEWVVGTAQGLLRDCLGCSGCSGELGEERVSRG